MKEVLGRQKRQLGILAGALVALALIAAGVVVGRKKGKEEKKTSSIEPAPVAATAPELTSRDKEILDLLAKGYTATQIAEALSLSPETIRWYRKRLLEKFDVANTPELIFQARELGVI
jgi:DNA-binding CsgD family transcriptional regulator